MLSILAALVQPPIITVASDNTRIDRTCVVRFERPIADVDNNGVIQIMADGITVEFEKDRPLRGCMPGESPDQFVGVGVAIQGHRDVTIRNARIEGFKVGLRAEGCDNLTIEGGDFSNNFHQRLKSTPAAEDGSDWLYPHHNDDDQWQNNYGAAIAVKKSSRVTISNVVVRRGQNGIILDRVTKSNIFDNDCSFLSGWGIAMWRSSGNTISRNALDFCVRGYSHGVYSRGQDSAGLLMFEQCEDNQIIENSITHGGDGVFGFAGREAIGEATKEGFDYTRRGCNRNTFLGNDLSYAAAHGLEMTFSHGNRISRNRFVENAICGIWGGYSTRTTIDGNTFESCGDMAYGMERGGINIEHGSANVIVANMFAKNKCGVHLWWDDDGQLLKLPGVAASGSEVLDNLIYDNSFFSDAIALQLRDLSPDKSRVRGTVFANNATSVDVKKLEVEAGIPVASVRPRDPEREDVKATARGEKRPVGARSRLWGRQNIIMTEWGPWDHEAPLVRATATAGARHQFELRNYPADTGIDIALADGSPWKEVLTLERSGESGVKSLTVSAARAGVYEYRLNVGEQSFPHTLIGCRWNVALFGWQGVTNPPSPPADLEAWRALAAQPNAVRASVDELKFAFGGRGPSGVKSVPEFAASKLGGSLYGLIATTKLPLPRGEWKFKTTSDDGIRVIVDGKTLIENWTHHAPTADSATLKLAEPRTVEITVEYFQIAGHAVLEFALERVR